uniref:Uncharacterized protein n=1 Tax=Aquila chrysaetos chrysaetos TaxID=223781 RepID=A0A663FB54_AQUCH
RAAIAFCGLPNPAGGFALGKRVRVLCLRWGNSFWLATDRAGINIPRVFKFFKVPKHHCNWTEGERRGEERYPTHRLVFQGGKVNGIIINSFPQMAPASIKVTMLSANTGLIPQLMTLSYHKPVLYNTSKRKP